MVHYKNKDFVIWKCLAKTQDDWSQMFEPFLHPLFEKWCGLSEKELYNMYGILNKEPQLLHFTKETEVMVGHYGTSYTFIIPNENIEFIKYFEEQAPMKFYKRLKRIQGLHFFATSRDLINENFKEWVEPHKVGPEYITRFKKFYDTL